MQIITRQLQYDNPDTLFTLYHLTDMHIGAAACDEKLLRQDIQRVADDPNAYWIGGGDYIDAIARKGDKRYMEDTLAPWLRGKNDVIGYQIDYVTDLLAPIAHKCLALVKGNHEAAAEKYADRAVYAEIVRRLAAVAKVEPKTLALGVHGFVNLSFRYVAPNSEGRGWAMKIYTHHGYGGGSLPGGHALALGRVLGDVDCDLALLGHRHVGQHIQKVTTRSLQKSIVQVQRMGVFVPSYLGAHVTPSTDWRPVDTYAEEHGLRPTPLGTTPIVIQPYERSFHLIVSSNSSSHLRIVR